MSAQAIAARGAAALPAARRLARCGALAMLGAVGLPMFLLVAVIIPAAHHAQSEACPDLIGEPGDPASAAAGALGGVAGTGVTRAELDIVRAGRTPAVTGGSYLTTAYGPPWGGIQGAGISTAAGLRLNGGAPRRYMVAVDPTVNAYGSWLYIWPNPFAWKGPFLAADTGSAIRGRRIDFYDWRGRTTQAGWGRVLSRVSARPFLAGDLPNAGEGPLLTPVAGAALDPACSPAGVAIGGSGAGRDAIKAAVTFLGQSARRTRFAGFTPPSVAYAWCAWFVTNLWRNAGVPIPVNAYSGYPYQWAAAGHRDLLIKAPGARARTLRLPVGTALMYGGGPASSVHINLVRAANPDGTVQIIGGNQGDYPGHVTTYGPCRLTNGPTVRSSCDPRPIWAIVAPAADRAEAT